MHHFEDGYKFTYNETGDIIFKGDDTTYVGAVYKNLKLNSLLDLEIRDSINLNYSSIIKINRIYTTKKYTTFNLYLYEKYLDKYTIERNVKRNIRYKKVNTRYHKYNKSHKKMQLFIQKERNAVYTSSYNDSCDICSPNISNTSNKLKYVFIPFNNICKYCEENHICKFCNIYITNSHKKVYTIKHIYQSYIDNIHNIHNMDNIDNINNVYNVYNKNVEYISCKKCDDLFLNCNYCGENILLNDGNKTKEYFLCNECYMYIIPT